MQNNNSDFNFDFLLWLSLFFLMIWQVAIIFSGLSRSAAAARRFAESVCRERQEQSRPELCESLQWQEDERVGVSVSRVTWHRSPASHTGERRYLSHQRIASVMCIDKLVGGGHSLQHLALGWPPPGEEEDDARRQDLQHFGRHHQTWIWGDVVVYFRFPPFHETVLFLSMSLS